MRRSTHRLACAVVATLLIALPTTAEEPDEPSLAPLMMGYSALLDSATLGEQRELLIYLPMSYRFSAAAYPVLWVLDGRANFHHASGSAAVLAMHGIIPEMIVVGVVNVDRDRDFTAVERPDHHSGGAVRFLDFLAAEAVPFIDETFRTLPHRTLMGHSLGSLLAVHAAIQKPDLFQAFILVSPALSSDNRELPTGVKPVVEQLDDALAAHDPRRDLFFHLTMSENNEAQEWRDDLVPLKRVLRRHEKQGVRWDYRSMADETHGTNPVKSTYDGLKELYAPWHDLELLASGDAGKIAAHYDEVSDRFGYPVTPPEETLNRVAYGLLEGGRARRAQALFELAVKSYPGSANVYDSLGECLERQGKLEQALASYQQAVQRAETGKLSSLPIFLANHDRVAAALATQAR